MRDLIVVGSPTCDQGCPYCDAIGFRSPGPDRPADRSRQHGADGWIATCGLTVASTGELEDEGPVTDMEAPVAHVVNLASTRDAITGRIAHARAVGSPVVALAGDTVDDLHRKVALLADATDVVVEVLLIPWQADEAVRFAAALPQELIVMLRLAPVTSCERPCDLEGDLISVMEQLGSVLPLAWRPTPSTYLDLTSWGPQDHETDFPSFEVDTVTASTPFPSLSVIIAAHRPAPTIRAVLRALMEQRCSATWELIVVEDGPLATSIDLDAGLNNVGLGPSSCLRVRVERAHARFRAGVVRNLGAHLAAGQNLLFLDDDMLVGPTFLEDVTRELDDGLVLMAQRKHLTPAASERVTTWEAVGPGDTYVFDDGYWDEFHRNAMQDGWMALDHPYKYVCSHSLALRADLFRSVGGFRRRFECYGFEDTELGYRLWRSGARFRLTDGVVHHFHPIERIDDHRDEQLAITARQFFRSTLDAAVFEHFSFMMGAERKEAARAPR